MLSPKRTKFRKSMKGRMRGNAKGGDYVAFGDFGIQATTCGRLTSRQIEAARIAISRHVKRGGTLSIRVFPDKPPTKKPAEPPSGKGRGGNEDWVAVIRPGRILYELEGVDEKLARERSTCAPQAPHQHRVVSREAAL